MQETTAETLGNFMRWAAMRIQQEVEENERIESKAGTRDFILGSGDTKKQDYTNGEKLDIIDGIDELREEGNKVSFAASQFGIHSTTYHKWKRQLNK
jgi:hypothetical protein